MTRITRPKARGSRPKARSPRPKAEAQGARPKARTPPQAGSHRWPGRGPRPERRHALALCGDTNTNCTYVDATISDDFKAMCKVREALSKTSFLGRMTHYDDHCSVVIVIAFLTKYTCLSVHFVARNAYLLCMQLRHASCMQPRLLLCLHPRITSGVLQDFNILWYGETAWAPEQEQQPTSNKQQTTNIKQRNALHWGPTATGNDGKEPQQAATTAKTATKTATTIRIMQGHGWNLKTQLYQNVLFPVFLHPKLFLDRPRAPQTL